MAGNLVASSNHQLGTNMAMQDDRSPAHATDAIIDVRGLVKQYGSLTAVDGVNLQVMTNEIFGILGPNGAGKTTTLEMVEGLREPDAGSITIAGIDVVADPAAVKRVIGVQLQSTALFDHLSARELIELFAALSGGDSSRRRADELIALVSLDEKADSYADQLSGGQRQRLSIALALVNDPSVVFLDEPTTGLDPQARRNLWDLIRHLRDSGKTVVLTTHYMEEADVLCDRVAVMDHGQIIACDTPLALIQSLDVVASINARVNQPLDISDLPGALDSSTQDDQITVSTRDVPLTLTALLARAAERGVQLQNLSTSQATLEDVFLTMTGRSLRE
ncbi:MAG: ATP-binding cassette domain-containing protein [Thermomicrobiales bacterium]|nr:ATP-binding cassette domain-containing protein [Thermomicrobiales bacterium]